MNNNLYFHGTKSTKMYCSIIKNAVSIDFITDNDYNQYTNIQFWSTDPIDFKNQVLWAFEKWEREQKKLRKEKEDANTCKDR